MELRQLRYFSEVVRQGSYRRAAARLNITQPALSKSIRALETELGVRLLERGMHGVSPTPFGSVLFDGAELISRDLNRTIEHIHRLNHGASGGTVRIGGMTTVMRWILPPVAKVLARVNPTARIDVHIALVDDLLALLETGGIDLAVGTAINSRV